MFKRSVKELALIHNIYNKKAKLKYHITKNKKIYGFSGVEDSFSNIDFNLKNIRDTDEKIRLKKLNIINNALDYVEGLKTSTFKGQSKYMQETKGVRDIFKKNYDVRFGKKSERSDEQQALATEYNKRFNKLRNEFYERHKLADKVYYKELYTMIDEYLTKGLNDDQINYLLDNVNKYYYSRNNYQKGLTDKQLNTLLSDEWVYKRINKKFFK